MIARVLSLTLLFFCINISSAQNNILRGVVKLQSSGSQPIENVEISAFGSNTVYSNSSGMFQMEFPSKGPGSTVNLLVNKAGYEVINEKEIERCIIRSNPDELLIIVMAKQGERNRQALSYYNIILQNSDNTFKKELNSLKGQLSAIQDNDQERKVLLDQIEALQQEKEHLLQQAEQLAQQLASVDLDQASELAKNAFEEFNNGNIKAALDILNDESLAENLKISKEEKDRISERLNKADQAYQQSIDNYMIKARFLISSSAFGSAIDAYKSAYEADSNNINRILEIAKFHGRISKQNSSIRLYDRAFIISNDYKQKIEILVDQSRQYRYNEQFDLSYANINKARELYNEWKPEESDVNRYTKGEIEYSEASLLMQLNKHEEALEIMESMLREYKDFSEKDEIYQSMLYATQLNMATMYFYRFGEFGKAEKMLDSAISNYQKLYTLDSLKYSIDLADVYVTQGGLYAYTRQFIKAESCFKQSLELFKVNLDADPYLARERIAKSYTNLGSTFAQQGKFKQAIESHQKSSEILKELALKNPIRYQMSLSKSFNNIGYVYNGQGKYLEAVEQYKKAVSIREDLYSINSQRFSYDLCDAYLSTSGVLENTLRNTLDMKHKDEALLLLDRAYKVWGKSDTTTRKAQEIHQWINHFTTVFKGFDEEELSIQRYINDADAAYAEVNSSQDLDVLQNNLLTIIESLSNGIKIHQDNQRLLDKQSFIYSELAWILINYEKPSEAENYVREGMVLNSSNLSLKSYLPTALLLQGKKDEAVKIYLEMKDIMDGREPFKATFLDDLDRLEASGITHPDFDDIRKLLNE